MRGLIYVLALLAEALPGPGSSVPVAGGNGAVAPR